MNLKKIIWRSSHVEELIGIGWAALAILSGIWSSQTETPLSDILKFAAGFFAFMAIAGFYNSIKRAKKESAEDKEVKKYRIIKEDNDRIMMKMIENEDDHPEIIEHNGCMYRLEYCNGKDAVFRKEK